MGTFWQVRETMRIMGLRVWTHEVSWLITGIVTFSFIALSVAALLSWTFLPLADGTLLLVFMLAFMLSEVGMALAVSSLFSKVTGLSICGMSFTKYFNHLDRQKHWLIMIRG